MTNPSPETTTETLLKYDPPILVENLNATKKKKNKDGGVSTPTEINPQQGTIDFLDSVLPPKRWSEGDDEYIQHVSIQPSSRSDVLKLDEQLENLLKERKSRSTGICNTRSALYEDCFKELIREVAIDSHERASLLIQVKEELDLTIAAYEELYESAAAFGIRKAVHEEQDKNALCEQNSNLEKEIEQFQNKINDLKNRMEEAIKNDQDDLATKNKEHAEKVATQRAENAALRQKLEEMLSPPKP